MGNTIFGLSLLLLTNLAICSKTLAQTSDEQLVVQGKVTDKDTKEPLAFATIRIKGKPIGVVSNLLGEFQFKFSDTYSSDTLYVSMLGYTVYEQVIKNIKNKEMLIVRLEERVTVLQEVSISEKELTAKEIVEKAVQNISNNYPQNPYILEGFYRDYKKENGTYVVLFEAAVSIYDRGYSNPKNKQVLQERVYLDQVRKTKSIAYKAAIYKKMNVFRELLRENDVRYVRKHLNVKDQEYVLEELTFLDDKLVYVISTGDNWTYSVYIDTESFAILKLELNAKWEGEKQNEWAMNDSIMLRTTEINGIVNFKKYKGKYYPAYMNYDVVMEGFEKSSGKIVFTSDFYEELLINNIIIEEVKKPKSENLMSSNKVLELQSKPYNDAFWKRYNVIKETPLDLKIIQNLEKEGSLEGQFESSGNPTHQKKRKSKE